MKRLTLHIGSHKTGTTSVQWTLMQNARLLRDRGLSLLEGSGLPHLHSYLDWVNRDAPIPDGYRVRDPAVLAHDLAHCETDHVFGSSENFSFFFHQDAVDDLAAALKPQFDDIRIVAYLRRQDRHAISHHLEGARPDRPLEGQLWGHALTALPLPAAHHQLYLDYDRRIGRWENAFGTKNVTVRLFDRALLQGGDIVTDLLGVMGIDHGGLDRRPDANAALGRVEAKIGHIANGLLANDVVTTALLDALPATTDRLLPSVAQAKAFLDPYRDSNRRLNARLGISTFPDLFPDDFDDYPDTASDGWNPPEVDGVMTSVIRALTRDRSFPSVLTVEDLRTAAIALEHSAPKSAYRLVTAALELRPSGPFLIKLRRTLENRLRAQNLM